MTNTLAAIPARPGTVHRIDARTVEADEAAPSPVIDPYAPHDADGWEVVPDPASQSPYRWSGQGIGEVEAERLRARPGAYVAVTVPRGPHLQWALLRRA